MAEIIGNIISNILTAIYQPFWFALILAVLFMFVFKKYSDVKSALTEWVTWFKKEKYFRKIFLLVFYTVLILFRTLLNRNMWSNPVSNVIGEWGLYKQSNGKWILTTEVSENIILFLPFTFLLFWVFREKIFGKALKLYMVLLQSFKIVFLCSLTIETLQLFLRLGTWQLSDLFFNTLGGIIGGIIYWVCYQLKHISECKKK